MALKLRCMIKKWRFLTSLVEIPINIMKNSNIDFKQRSSQTFPLLVWRLAFGACLLVVLVFALMPIDMGMPSTGWDKSNHLLAFSVLALLGLRAYPGRTRAVLAGLLTYGVLVEVFQSFTPNRSADWQDVLADSVGLLTGWALQLLGLFLLRFRANS
jgi:VanZ family protein